MSATTELERRLAAALEARAELVQPDDLRPMTPPHADPTTADDGGPDHPRWRRAGLYAAVAAASAAVIAAPSCWSTIRPSAPTGTWPHPLLRGGSAASAAPAQVRTSRRAG